MKIISDMNSDSDVDSECMRDAREDSDECEVYYEYDTTRDAREDSDECEVYYEYDTTEEMVNLAADAQYSYQQSLSNDDFEQVLIDKENISRKRSRSQVDSDNEEAATSGHDNEEMVNIAADAQYSYQQSLSNDDFEQVLIDKENISRKRSRSQVDSDNEEASTSGHDNKKNKASMHNQLESERRCKESVLFEELAQDDEKEDEVEGEYEDGDVDEGEDDNFLVLNNSYQAAQDNDDNESYGKSNGFGMNNLQFFDPNGVPWKTEQDREDFFDHVVKKAEEISSDESDNESDDSEENNDDSIPEGIEDVLKYFGVYDPDDNDPAEKERLKQLDNDDDTEGAKEDAKKTRILVQSVFSIATIFHKFPLSKAIKLEKKVENIKKECLAMRAALIANGFPEHKLPRTITK